MTDDLLAFLRAQLDYDELVAWEATRGPWEVGPTFGGRDSRVYVKPAGPGIDTIGTCVIAGQVANTPEFRANAEHIARWDPARVLAEVEAKRRILDEVAKKSPGERGYGVAAQVAKLLALPYDSRPGYRKEWRP